MDAKELQSLIDKHLKKENGVFLQKYKFVLHIIRDPQVERWHISRWGSNQRAITFRFNATKQGLGLLGIEYVVGNDSRGLYVALTDKGRDQVREYAKNYTPVYGYKDRSML